MYLNNYQMFTLLSAKFLTILKGTTWGLHCVVNLWGSEISRWTEGLTKFTHFCFWPSWGLVPLPGKLSCLPTAITSSSLLTQEFLPLRISSDYSDPRHSPNVKDILTCLTRMTYGMQELCLLYSIFSTVSQRCWLSTCWVVGSGLQTGKQAWFTRVCHILNFLSQKSHVWCAGISYCCYKGFLTSYNRWSFQTLSSES